MKKTTLFFLILALVAGLGTPLRGAPLPDDLRADDEADDEAPPAKVVHPLDRRPPPTNDPENRFLPPEIREDVERLPTPASALPGEADADDGTTEPDAPAASVASEAPEPMEPAPSAPPVRKPAPARLPGRVVKKPVRAWKRPAAPVPEVASAIATDAAKPMKTAAQLAAQAERERKKAEKDRLKAEREAKREAAEVDRLNQLIAGKAARDARRQAAKAAKAAKAANAATAPKAYATTPVTAPTGQPVAPSGTAAALTSSGATSSYAVGLSSPPADTRTAALPPRTLAGSPHTPGQASDAYPASPVVVPSPAPTKGKKKRGKKHDPVLAASPAPGASPGVTPPETAKPGKREKGSKGRKRDREFARTGEEAPIEANASARNAVAPATATAPYVDTLRAMLASLVDGARNPMERDIALPYLGFVGDKTRLAKMYERVDDPKADDGEKLPVIAALVDGYDDRTRLPRLHKIADDPKAPSFQRLWALEILAQAGDRSRIAVTQALIDDKATDANDRMRALQVLATLGDDSRRDTAKKLANDGDLFLATRMQALACLARMEKGAKKGTLEGVNELKKVMQRSHLSVEERLSIALDLVQVGETSTKDFLEHVVEAESDTIFDQLRALHGLALLGASEHLGLLQETFQTKKRPRNTARRILVLMGDRSRIPDLIEDARVGDLEAVRTLVLAAVLDQQKLPAAALLSQPRFKSLIAP